MNHVKTNPYEDLSTRFLAGELCKLQMVLSQAQGLRAMAEKMQHDCIYKPSKDALEDFTNQLSDITSDLMHTYGQAEWVHDQEDATLEARHDRSLAVGSSQV